MKPETEYAILAALEAMLTRQGPQTAAERHALTAINTAMVAGGWRVDRAPKTVKGEADGQR